MKTKLLFAIGILTLNLELETFNCFGQNWLWAKSAPGNSEYNESHSVAADANGNAFLTGNFSSPSITFGAITLINTGISNVFLTKYDPNGNVLWAKKSVGSGVDYGFSISADVNGNAFLTGHYNSPTITFGSVTLTNTGNYDVFVVKYDANGNVLWAKNSVGSGIDESHSVSADAVGNAFVTGYFKSATIGFGSTTLTNAGVTNIFITKYDANGSVLWAKSAGGTGYDYGRSIAADPAGNAFVTGYYRSSTLAFGTTILTNTGFGNVFIAKYDALGNIIWAKSAGTTGDNEAFSASADPSGNVFITGYFWSSSITFGSTTLTNAGLEDVFLAKYDAAGNVLWAKSAGGIAPEAGFSVSADIGGNVFLTGSFLNPTLTFGTTTITQPANAAEPMFIVKYDAAGNVVCAEALSSGGVNQNAVSADRYGNAYIGSHFQIHPFIVGSYTLTLTNYEDVFIAKYNCCSGSAGNISGITNILQGDSSILTASGGISYLWNTGATTAAIKVIPISTTTYCAAINNSGCLDTTCITVTVETLPISCEEIFVPTAFSPNGDKQNDLECIFGDCIENILFFIYDRWGNKVFETSDSKTCWDGKYKGQTLHTDIFTYYMEATLSDRKQIKKKGNISLVR